MGEFQIATLQKEITLNIKFIILEYYYDPVRIAIVGFTLL